MWVLETAGTRIHGITRRQPYSHYLQSEKSFLKPLPDKPVEIFVWKRFPSAAVNCHLLIEDNHYSFPYTLIKKELWAKVSDTMVWIYEGYELKAAHVRHFGNRQKISVATHMSPKAQTFFLHNPDWCLKRAATVGPACQSVVERLFADKVMDNLRGVQGILGFIEKNGADRLEAACERALAYGSPRYQTIKLILNRALDTQPVSTAVSRLPEIYRNGGTRFSRTDKKPSSPPSPTDTPKEVP
ncbi:MAG: Mu transposase domain-containing protein [Leptospirales bacterium]